MGLCSSDMILKKIKLTVFAVYTHYFFFFWKGTTLSLPKTFGNVWEEILTGTILEWCYWHLVAEAKDTN